MKMMKEVLLLAALLAIPPMTNAGEEVDRLLGEYAKIETVTCQIRRTKEGGLGKMKFISRVYWTNKDQIHAEGIAPVKRRTIADGTRLFQYVEGDPKGFSRPIDELSEQMAISLRFVPGSAMDHLLRLKELEETVLEPLDNGEKCVGIAADSKYIVLSFDEANRLTGIRFYASNERKELQADYAYSAFSEVAPGVWIPFTQNVEIHGEGVDFSEAVKIDNFVANQPIAGSLFIPGNFFDKKIDFVDDFAKIFRE